MKKIAKALLLIVVVFNCIALFTSCSKLDRGLSGWYSSDPESSKFADDDTDYDYRSTVFHFKNKNTVVIYRNVYQPFHWPDSVELQDHPGWYTLSEGSYESYTVIDNQVYITTTGDILVIDGDTLYKGREAYRKW